MTSFCMLDRDVLGVIDDMLVFGDKVCLRLANKYMKCLPIVSYASHSQMKCVFSDSVSQFAYLCPLLGLKIDHDLVDILKRGLCLDILDDLDRRDLLPPPPIQFNHPVVELIWGYSKSSVPKNTIKIP